MKILYQIGFLFLMASCANNFVKQENVVYVQAGTDEGESVEMAVEVLSPTVVRVAKATSDSLLRIPSIVVDPTFSTISSFDVKAKGDFVNVYTDSLLVKINTLNGQLSYYDHQGLLLLAEGAHEITAYHNDIVGDQYNIKQNFVWDNDEVLYGLGQHELEDLNLRGQHVELTQKNTRISNPVLLSTKLYGIYWDNYSRSVFNDTSDSSYLSSEVADKIQYYFIKGYSFDELIASYRDLTGHVPMLPKWAFGYIQSRNRYKTRDELMGVVKKQRALGIPINAIILDYLHWEKKQGFGSMSFDPINFPSPEQMIEELHDTYNCKLIVSVWPSFKKHNHNWQLLKDKDLLLDLNLGVFGDVYDAFNPEAGALYYDMVKKNYLDKGVDAIWFDATEPEQLQKFEKIQTHIGPAAKYLNLFSYFDTKHIFEQQTKDAYNRPFMLTRSAFAGQQKFGSIAWSGDIGVDFQTLKEQIPTGLNFCMTGLPFWNTDIGGYAGGDPKDPAYQEVFIRWFQYGAFTPFFRAHGRRHPMQSRSGENELWSYGESAQEILTDFVKLRYRLMPYIYTMAHKVNSEGYTMMRALAFDFINDREVYEINDQFMFGASIMVCPVLEAGATTREVYLPQGCDWFDFWTGKKYSGGQLIVADAPIERLPLFVKAGSIIPMSDVVNYTGEKADDQLEIRVYPGANSSFTLYEDEGKNNKYKEGQFSEIEINFTADKEMLSFGSRKGRFAGMLEERKFNVVIVNEGEGLGIDNAKTPNTIDYSGKSVSVD